jgi:hypothetical protein
MNEQENATHVLVPLSELEGKIKGAENCYYLGCNSKAKSAFKYQIDQYRHLKSFL